MKIGKTLLAGLSGFLVFMPFTFLWHTVLFSPYYIGPTLSVKSADAFNPALIAAANLVLVVAMAFFVPPLLGATRRVMRGALVGAVFASVLVDYHNLSLMGLFPGQDPLSLYALDAAWAIIDGFLTGAVVVFVSDRLTARERAGEPQPV